MTAIALFALALASLLGQTTGLDPTEVVRIREAFRLTEAVQDSVWPDGWGPVPYPLLRVTPEREFLIAFPRIPSGFTEAGSLSPFEAPNLQRPRQLQPNLSAAFPAFGPPSVIVVGRPEATGKTSTSWVLTVVHEHFHQFQTADPAYYPAVEELDLSGGDPTGMWMLNYPFPVEPGRGALLCTLPEPGSPAGTIVGLGAPEILGKLCCVPRRSFRAGSPLPQLPRLAGRYRPLRRAADSRGGGSRIRPNAGLQSPARFSVLRKHRCPNACRGPS